MVLTWETNRENYYKNYLVDMTALLLGIVDVDTSSSLLVYILQITAEEE